MSLLAALILTQLPQVQCVTTNGKTACPQTPWGRCVATSGRLFCGDPSYETMQVLQDPPPVECVTTSGTGACGYGCKTTSGKAACAQTPWGDCVTTSGRIYCADPAPWAIRTWASRTREPMPRVSCVTTSGLGACGYDCKTTSGKAACSAAPWGRCVASNGNLTCSP